MDPAISQHSPQEAITAQLERKENMLRPPEALASEMRQHAKVPTVQVVALCLMLVIAAILCYASSFSGVFLFDDEKRIVTNPVIRQGLLAIWPSLLIVERPLVVLSFALNYEIGRLNVWGYHAVNLAIHILAALMLWGLFRRTLLTPRLRARYAQSASWLATAVALIWVVHPLNTESVTYINQRAESLMGLCALVTLYGVLRGSELPQVSWRWYGVALVACTLGTASKATTVTVPLVVLLYDHVFLASSFQEIFRRRGHLYAALAATWGVAAYLIARSEDSMRTVGVVSGVTPLTYLLTQCEVIAHYLKLAVWPSPLILDYGWPVVSSLGPVLAPGALVIGLLAMTLWALRHHPRLGFLGAWFFLTLAPTSSIIPIQDLAVEHRMYLPLVAIIAGVVLGLAHLLSRVPLTRAVRRGMAVALTMVTVTALGVTTFHRNQAYASELGMWSAVVAHRPHNARAHLSLGTALGKSGHFTGARTAYVQALQINPTYPEAWDGLGALLAQQEKYEEALAAFTRALELNPRLALAHLNRGTVLIAQGKVDEAVSACTRALQLKPNYAATYGCLGVALAKQGKVDEALAALLHAHRLNPEDEEISSNLTVLLASAERTIDQ